MNALTSHAPEADIKQIMPDKDTFEALKHAKNTRAGILNAAMICIMTIGPTRTNISSIASQAGVSRPTVYAHFERLEDLIQEAITQGTKLLVSSLEAYASPFETPRERILQAFLRLLNLSEQVDVLRKPMSFEVTPNSRDMIPDEAIIAARSVLANLIGDKLTDETAANERAETAVRFFLSLAAFRRKNDVQGYITRVVLPAMGL